MAELILTSLAVVAIIVTLHPPTVGRMEGYDYRNYPGSGLTIYLFLKVKCTQSVKDCILR